ncbi:hypothetical protein K435DRAFT_814351 [Dendrothele bispora CBS 962.96]|uniref:Uncharacterized protein n=1 Tax=Dendrothele bispora (strain CBS 962.96) TaxID=1314807 RepID=A0A4S8KIY0_DENBC|nr:hypothetical protein K435DRAFT_814351 [Dendrothele bispora CBS 962.96]
MTQRDGEYGWLNRARFVIEHGLVMRIAGQNKGDSKDLNVVSREVLLGQRDIIEVGRLQRRGNSDNWLWVRVEQNELPAMTGCSQQFANVLIPDFSPKRHMDDFKKEFGKELSEQGVDPELIGLQKRNFDESQNEVLWTPHPLLIPIYDPDFVRIAPSEPTGMDDAHRELDERESDCERSRGQEEGWGGFGSGFDGDKD